MRDGRKWFMVYLKMNDIVSLTLTLFTTPLSGFFPFSWWPFIFHFSLVIFLLHHCHLQYICLFPPPFFHSTRFIQCWSLCDLHVALAIFAQLFIFLFCDFFARSLWHYLQFNFHLWLFQALSLSLYTQFYPSHGQSKTVTYIKLKIKLL